MENLPLGRRMHTRGTTLKGSLSTEQWHDFVKQATAAIGMEAVGVPGFWQYPVNEKGGVGFTLVQPITESFVCLDTWSDHNGAYLFICSCRPIRAAKLRQVIADFHLVIHNEFSIQQELPND